MGLDKDNNHFSELVSRAYKKLKSYAYYDKNAFYLKTMIAEFESDQTVDVFLKEFAVKLQNRDYSTRDTGAPIVLPKKVDKGNGLFFSNVPLNPTIKKIQCFTPMSIEDGIIAVLWVMTVGFKIDKGLLEEAYGNRVNKSHDSWSPHLFKPFPFQYSSWRDNGVKAAIRCVEDGKSCAFINTDFSAFFYNLYLEESVREKIVSNYCEDELESYLTKLVFGFIDAYSKDHFGGNVLPIGYPPSNVLSNYLLSGFDRRIHDNLLPEYYGRYVDDIILVVRFNPEDALKLESPSELLWRELKKAGFNVKFSEQDAQPTNTLVMCLPNSKLQLSFGKEKTHSEIINPDYSASQLELLKKNIEENSSEFRYMPYEDISDINLDCLSIFEESESELHKPGEMKDITVSRYKLSKYLGKMQMLSSLVNDGQKSESYCRSLMGILTPDVLIENWFLWERLLQICLSCETMDAYENTVITIRKAIETMEFGQDCQGKTKIKLSGSELDNRIRHCLKENLLVAIARTLCTRWGPDIQEWVCSSSSDYSKDNVMKLRRSLCIARMADSHHFILPIDGLINNGDLILNDSSAIRTMSLAGILGTGYSIGIEAIKSYPYRPYLLKMHELCFCMLGNLDNECAADGAIARFSDLNMLFQEYMFVNYGVSDGKQTRIHSVPCNDMDVIIVGDDKTKDFKVGISNVCQPSPDIFDRAVGNEDGRTSGKLEMTKRIFNHAIRDGAEILVMPECYLPSEWLPFCIRTCMKNGMMLITGLEYINQGENVYNITVTAMPFEDEYGHKDAVVSFHIKRHYAPSEERAFSSAGMKCIEGKNNQLYIWNGLRFTTFCCFEMADIDYRAKYRSRIHALFAVESNKDVNYFDNIVGATSRDLHCYVIQVNNAAFGDNRITAPCKKEEMNLVRISGGDNPAVIIGTMKIPDLIKFRRLEEGKDNFKPKPPGFSIEIAE